jgi:hypothetical protein
MNRDIPPELWPHLPQEQREALHDLAEVLVELVVREIQAEQSSPEGAETGSEPEIG